MTPVIFGCSGPQLSSGEVAFFRDCNPWAFILFGRNIESPEQVRKLCADLRESVGRDALIFTDQEGGRVQRLGPPLWRKAPWASLFDTLYDIDETAALRAIWLNFRLIAEELRLAGITADCAPVLDLPVFGADPIVSDRAFSTDKYRMVHMADACMAGLIDGGVVPVIKHMPGHGRATVDSHKSLPIIDTPIEILDETDFFPFKALAQAPMAMTAHVVLSEIDPKKPATISKKVIDKIIRDRLGFDGLLMSDDLDMKALSGDLTQLTEQTLAAGCDIVLQCSGELPAMVKIAKGLPPLDGKSAERARIAELMSDEWVPFDQVDALREYEDIMRLLDKDDE
ncbi:MAG TPA: beta-N-acetylhexosaminidase [Hellea balneolensis]|uniref:beta-N-acetylhexosaminidase n=1 Tax=Hellea balneolensis TaxID=287478 RepID=A0A7C5LVP3_9PROT|nr:beta-N-acetylhexosaminidase [Hellea balneolensis]